MGFAPGNMAANSAETASAILQSPDIWALGGTVGVHTYTTASETTYDNGND